MQATWRGRLVAESARAAELGGYVYFPREAVRMELLQAAPRTESDRACPHGVQFYDLVAGTERSERAPWSYEAPGPARKSVDHWMGFWEDVDVA